MIRRLLLSIVLLSAFTACQQKTYYMFSYFGDQSYGLKLAFSEDGYHFTQAYKTDSTPFLVPQLGRNKLLRDPSIIKGADGLFHMVWTTGWSDQIIGHASSKDLVYWSTQQIVPAMTSIPSTVNSWAPELFYDEPSGLYYIFWASTVPGAHNDVAAVEAEQGYNHRIYAITTKDFKEYSETFKFFDQDFSVIDAAIVRSPIDNSLIMALKNENSMPAEKNIRICKRINEDGSPAMSLTEGQWGPVSDPISGEIWAEGPSPVFKGDTLLVYYDQFSSGTYGISRSLDNGNTWEILPRDQYSFPTGGCSHGTVFKITEEEYRNFKNNL